MPDRIGPSRTARRMARGASAGAMIIALLGAVVMAMAPTGAHAQDWRDITSFRQRGAEGALDVHVRYGAGELVVRPGAAGELYRVGIRYDSDLFEPISAYRDGRLEVGVEGTGRGIRLRNNQAGEMTLALSRDVPLRLDLDFGAVEADMQLGGLRIERMDIETGASDTDILFNAPNPIECERFELSMGAAAFQVSGLGNANCRRIDAEGGVGDLTLDFSGAWRQDMRADVTMALGSVTLVIPEDIGVRVDKDTFLTDFDRTGFDKRGDTYYSRNWEAATRRLELQFEGAFGSINVRWSSPAGALTP
jgi:hypothetical protein